MHGFRGVAGLSAGSCVREDANVGGAGFCGDVFAGATYFAGDTHWGPRFSVELGVGYNNSSSAGEADLGLTQTSGGAVFVARGWIGVDFTRLFFAQLGGQAQINSAPGGQGLIELGGRLLHIRHMNLELGVREQVGCDGIRNGGLGVDGVVTHSLSYGTTGFLRFVFP